MKTAWVGADVLVPVHTAARIMGMGKDTLLDRLKVGGSKTRYYESVVMNGVRYVSLGTMLVIATVCPKGKAGGLRRGGNNKRRFPRT